MHKEGKGSRTLPVNFLRHYYDLYQLIEVKEVKEFIGTPEYEAYKKERFHGDDTKVSNSEAFRLTNKEERALFEKEYLNTKSLYFRGQPSFSEILDRLGKSLAIL